MALQRLVRLFRDARAISLRLLDCGCEGIAELLRPRPLPKAPRRSKAARRKHAILDRVLRIEPLECRAMLTTLSFVGAVNNTWDLTTANWFNGTTNVAWQNGDTAVFAGTAATVTIAPDTAISAAEIDFTTGGYTIAAGSGGSLAVAGSGTVDVAPGIADTISAPLVGSSGLTLTDSGTLALGGANSYTGATLIQAGTLQLQNAAALGDSSGVAACSAGTLDLYGQAIGSAVPLDDFAGTLANSDSGVAASLAATINATTQDSFTVSGSGDIAISGTITGSSSVTLIKTGANTVTLGDASQLDGLSLEIDDGNVVQAGGGTLTTLDIGAGSTMTISPTGPIVVLTTLDWDPYQTGATTGPSGGSGTWDTTTADWYNPATGEDQAWGNTGDEVAVFSGAAGTVALDSGIAANALSFQTDGYLLQDGTLSAADNGGFVVGAGLTATVDTAIVGSTGVQMNGGGNLILGGSNTYTGATSIVDGTLVLANSTALGESDDLLCNADGTLDLDGQAIGSATPSELFEGTLVNSSDTAASFAGSINEGTYFGFDFTVAGSGDITLSGAVDNYGSTLTMAGAGTLTLSGATNDVGLCVTVDSGTLVLDKTSGRRAQAIEDGLTLDGGTVELSGTGGDQLDDSAITVGPSGGTIELNGLDDTADSFNGDGSLSIIGPGTLTLDDVSSNTGTITIGSGATLVADACMALTPTADYIVDGTLDMSGYDQTIGSLSGSGTVTNSAADTTAILIVGADNTSTTFSGTIADGGSGTVGLTATGSGVQTLTGANGYSGGTIIDGGTLQLGDGFSSNGSVAGNITDDGSLVFAEIYAQTYAGAISGAGSVAQDGYNALTLTGANTYTGATSVNAGALILGPGGSLGDTAISVADGAAFDPQPGSGTLSAGDTGAGASGATLTLASGSTFDMTDGATGTFNLQQQSGFSGTALSIDGATLNFDLSSSASDELAAGGAASVGGVNTIGITGISAGMTTEQSFTLVSAASGLSGTFEFANGTTTESLFEDNQTYTLELSNSGTAETLTVSALPDYAVFINGTFSDGSTAVDLGTAYANEPAIATVMIENTGSGTLTLSDPISLPTGFTLAADYGTLVLAAGQSTSFAIRLDSPVEGSFSGTLSITTDDPVQPTFDVTIGGTVVARAAGVDDANFDATGDGWTTVDTSAAVDGQELTAAAGTGENTASWVFNDLNPDIVYEVYATWTAADGQATNATYTIFDGSSIEGPADGGDGDVPNAPYIVGTLGTVSVDQTAAPADETVDGINWSSLGSFTATSGVMEIDLSDAANGTVVAGGIRIVAVHVTEPPVIEPVTNVTTTAGDDVSIQLGATDPDAPSGDLTYALLSGTPPGMSINSSTGLVTWDTTSAPAGTYGITAQVSDSGSPASTDVEEFSITVDNTATPTGSGEDTVIVYSSSDANEGGSDGNIVLLRTGDQTGALEVQFEIDETVGNAAQYGSALEYVGPDITTTVDGILYGTATFAADSNTTGITINASADTDNAVNPTVNFELLPDDYTIPGDALPDDIVSDNYNVGTPSTATPVIRAQLVVDKNSATIGMDEVVADHHVILRMSPSQAPAGATIAYSITGGNGAGMFSLTSSGALLLAANAASDPPATYTLSVQGVGTMPNGSTTNTSTATVTVTIIPSVGVYGDDIAVRDSGQYIDLTFERFGGDLGAAATVNFTVVWGSATAEDVVQDESYYCQLTAVSSTAGDVVIPAGDSTATMVLCAAPLAFGEPVVGIRSFSITVTGGTDTSGVIYGQVAKDGSSLYGSTSATTAVRDEDLYILDGLTAFASYNPVAALADTDSFGLGINPNDVRQGGIGDCYFMAALVLLAKSNPQAIENLITDNGDGTFVVKLYTGVGTTQETFNFSGNFLSNGWNMAQLSGDSASNGDVEIWPQLLEEAWVQLKNAGYRGIVGTYDVNDALVALTGQPYLRVSLAGFSNQEIGQLLLQAQNMGVPVAIATPASALGDPDNIALSGNAAVYFDHAYVVDSVGLVDGVVTSVTLINPWGLSLTGQGPADPDGNGTAIVVVPLADFSAAIGTMYFQD